MANNAMNQNAPQTDLYQRVCESFQLAQTEGGLRGDNPSSVSLRQSLRNSIMQGHADVHDFMLRFADFSARVDALGDERPATFLEWKAKNAKMNMLEIERKTFHRGLERQLEHYQFVARMVMMFRF